MKKQYYLMVLLFLFAPVLLTAGPKNMGTGWLQNQRMLDKLNLTDKQMDKIYKIKTATEKALIDLGATLRKAEIDLKDASFAEKIDESKIKNLIKKINKMRGKIFEKVALAKLESWKVLTSEQRKTVKKYMLYKRRNFRKNNRNKKKKW